MNSRQDRAGRESVLGKVLLLILAGSLAFLATCLGVCDGPDREVLSLATHLRLRNRTAGERVVSIHVDESSLGWAEENLDVRWPWPREVYGLMAEGIARSGASVIVFDILFSGDSLDGVADDLALQASLRKAGTVVLATSERVKPLPGLAASAAALGSVALFPDPDGIVRTYPIVKGSGSEYSLAAAALRVSGTRTPSRPGDTAEKTDPADMEKGSERVLPPMVFPLLTASGRRITRMSAASIISGLLETGTASPDPELFKKAAVFIGYSAPGLHDLQRGRGGKAVPGVDIHAEAYLSISEGRWLAPVPDFMITGSAAILAITTCLVLLASPAGLPVIVFFLLILLSFLLTGVAARTGFWLPPLTITLPALTIAFTAGVREAASTARQRLFLRRAFGHYLSPAVVEKLVRDPRGLSLGGSRRTVSVLFADLAGFTATAEKLDPERLSTLLNLHLSALSEAVFKEEGTIDKYQGDGLLAFWNAPLDQEDHAIRAVRAALGCVAAFDSLQPQYRVLAGEGEIPVPTGIRVGVHTGLAVAGNMGSHRRFNYTVVGDTVNLASRLEAANKAFGTSLLVSGETIRSSGAEGFRQTARIAVPGRSGSIVVFSPALEVQRGFVPGSDPGPAHAPGSGSGSGSGNAGGSDTDPAPEFSGFPDTRTAFETGRTAFERGDFEMACRYFSLLAPADPVASAYLERIATFGNKAPESWDGIWKVAEK